MQRKVFSSKYRITRILIQAIEGSGTDQEKAKTMHLFLLYRSPVIKVLTPCSSSTVSEEDSQWNELQKYQ